MHVSDTFRPRLPLDPFGALNNQPPWRAQLEPHNPCLPHTILLLGAPSYADLAPLSTSSSLASSLLIIATHTPPPIFHHSGSGSGPFIIILRLTAPLDIHDSGALRLVSLLERAQRVAQSWQMTSSPQPRLQQFSELFPGGEFSIAEEPQLAAVSVPSSSQPFTADDDDSISLSSSTFSSSSATLKSSSSKTKPLFSAIVNFLPPALPDKALLKNAILVTTLSTSFLAAPNPAQQAYTSRNKRSSFLSSLSLSSRSNDNLPRTRKRLSSLFFSPSAFTRHSSSSPPSLASTSCSPSSESLALPSSNTKSRPHLVHVLPYPATRSSSSPLAQYQRRSTTPAHPTSMKPRLQSVLPPHSQKTKLAESIEQFILSFAYPLSTSVSSPALVHTSHMVQTPPSPSSSLSSSSSSSLTTTTTATQAQAQAQTGARIPIRSSPLAAGTEGIDVLGKKHAGTSYPARRPSAGHRVTPSLVATIGIQPQHHRDSVMLSNTTANANQTMQAVPYILPAGVLGMPPGQLESHQTTVTAGAAATGTSCSCIGELILLGMLDGTATGGQKVGMQKHYEGSGVGGLNEGWPRAWIGGSMDVEVVGLGSTSGTTGTAGSSSSAPPMPGVTTKRVEKQKQDQGCTNEGGESESAVNRRASISRSSEDSKVRRNEAGLPTPPESTSSLEEDGDGESGDDDDDDCDQSNRDQVEKQVEKQRQHDQQHQQQQHRPLENSKSVWYPQVDPIKPSAPFLSLPSSSPRPRSQVHEYHYKRPQPVASYFDDPVADIASQKPKRGFKKRFRRFWGIGSTVSRKGEAR